MAFWKELARRNVVKVGAAYLVVAWLLIQIAVDIEEPLFLPPWFTTTVIAPLAIGFPIALIIAWALWTLRTHDDPHGTRPKWSRESRRPRASDRADATARAREYNRQIFGMSQSRASAAEYLRQWADEQAGAGNQFAFVSIAAWAAYYGMPEQALGYLRVAADDFGMHLSNIWIPLYRDVRRLDAFEDYMREIGTFDEWNAHGWPEHCARLGGDDFERI